MSLTRGCESHPARVAGVRANKSEIALSWIVCVTYARRVPPLKCNSPDKKCMRNKSQSAAAFSSRHNSNLRALPTRVPGIEKLLFARLPINRAFTRCHEQSGSLLPVWISKLAKWRNFMTRCEIFSDSWNATIKIKIIAARRVNVIRTL